MDEEEAVSRINEISKLASFVRWFLYKDCFQYTESDRPSLRVLYDHMVNRVAGKWKDLGVQLLSPEMVDIIAADHPHDVVSCCQCVLKKWLDTTTDATWNQLIKALRSPSVQMDYFAGQLEQMLITQRKFYVIATSLCIIKDG